MDFWWMMQSAAAASLVGAVIWGLKLLFHDKLDARWHYLIWLVLLARLLVPVQIDFIRTPISLFEAVPVLEWIDLCRLAASRAGWKGDELLWRVYLAGVLFLLLFYLASYLALRIRIAAACAGKGKTMRTAPEKVCRRVEEIARKYGVKACRRVCVEKTAFAPYVCGLWRTALVLPQGLSRQLEESVHAAREPFGIAKRADTDTAQGGFAAEEAVILHELLHRKYKDVLVNLLLHLVRAFQWCNPFLWYLTLVIQNDSEALCDQRVLEYMERMSGEGKSCEREYGMLLIGMASGKGKRPVRVGTSNMANSFWSMKIRIRRIADFKKVPSGIGIVTLCITLMLSISGIGYCREEEGLVSTDIRSEWDLRLALLEAQLYEANSPQEALYLYLAAMQSGNPVYLMAVLPDDMRQEYEGWVMERYGSEAFFEHNVWVEEWEESAYFPERPFWLTDFRIFNLRTAQKGRGQAGVLVSYKQDELLWWEIEFVEEDGWRVCKRAGKTVKDFEEPPLYELRGEGESFRVEVNCWNEGYFADLNQPSSMMWSAQGSPETGAGAGEKERVPAKLSMEYKMSAVYLVYTGNEDLTDRTVGVVIWEDATEQERREEYFRAMEQGRGTGAEVGVSLCLYDNRKGEDVKKNERLLIDESGSGPSRWEEEEIPACHARVYVDRKCVEEFEISLTGLVPDWGLAERR